MQRTCLMQAVSELAASSYPPFLAAHCRRSFELALLIVSADGLDVDLEVLHAGLLLHDLGLTRQFHSRSVRFEVAGADIARSFVRQHGMSVARADRVWDVVALHGTGGIAAHKSAETFAASRAIGGDVTGFGLAAFPQDAIDRIMATRPGFAAPFIEALVADLQDKPEVASGTWMAPIAAAHLAGFRQVSVEELAFANPYEHET